MRLLSVLVIGSLVSSIGSGMTAFALATWAFTTFGTASSVAMIELCALAPIVLLSPLAGVLADRHDRRTMMLLGDGGSALGLATVLIAVTRPEPSLLLVLAGVTVSSCLAALTEPALRATVNELVPSSTPGPPACCRWPPPRSSSCPPSSPARSCPASAWRECC